MTVSRKPLAITISALAILVLASASPAFAFIPCEDCEVPSNCRCAGFCNGVRISFCSDWFFYGCGNGLSSDHLDSLFVPSFLLPAAEERNYTPADGRFAVEPDEIPVAVE